MWDFNGEDDATRHGRKGPGSAADLVKILSGLYKGEKEDFLRTSPLNGFSMNNPRSWELRRDVEGIQSLTPQPEDPGRSLDPASEEDPDIKVELIDGVFHQLSMDNALVAITADYPSLSPASQDLTEKNTCLSQELQECKAQLEAALAAAGGATETPSEGARLEPDKQHLLRQLKAGEKVLMRVQQERNKLQDANTQLGEELKDVWVQLSDSVKENRRLRRGIYSVLTGRPVEEMPASTGDLLPELLQPHERIRQAMSGVVQAVWPSVSLPEGLGRLADKLQGVRQRFRLWKISACCQGAREAWAMVKTRYTKADPNHMAEVGPVGPDGKEIPVSLMYGQVELAAKYSQWDCKLDSLLDGVEEEFNQSI
ncbi:hypothetical protein VPH35_091439 [Triticum aestivum]